MENPTKLSLEDYIQNSWDSCDLYVKGVKDGSIKTNKWIKKAVDNYINDIKNRKDLDYREDKVDKVFKFFYHSCPPLTFVDLALCHRHFTLPRAFFQSSSSFF